MSMWQSIGTAPKDGKIIVVRLGKNASYHAKWSHSHWEPIEYDAPVTPSEWMVPDDDLKYHRDHPLRHFDRTCPACIFGAQTEGN